MKLKARKNIMREMIIRYGFDVMKGWADLHCIDLHADEDDTEWWLDNCDHVKVMAVDDVRDGHGVWTGINNQTENWVRTNADQMHSILWDIADQMGCNVWTYLEKHTDLRDQCSWALESILKREVVDYNFSRIIGFVVGNAITWTYQSMTYDGVGDCE